MLELYYYPDNASFAPHLLLAETHADYTVRLVDRNSNAQKSEEYLKLNPAGRIPTLVDGDLVLFESPAICIYICELDAGSKFIPPLGHPNRPLFFQWLTYLNNTLQAEYMLWRYAQNHATAADSIEDIKAAQTPRLAGFLSLLDRELSDKKFLLGEEISGADHFLFMMGLWCENAPQPTSSFANLLRFMREMSQRPAVQNVCEIEHIDLSRYA